jgi:hypothetical protein
MELYYRNDTLFVEVTNDLNVEVLGMLKRRIFRIIDDYGIDKIVINLCGSKDEQKINEFKKDYYHKYKGYLIIK